MKKIISLSFIIIFISSLVSCFDYDEINKITFVNAMIVDINYNNEVSVYLDCVTSYKNAKESQEKAKRIIFEGSGKTIMQAIEKIKSESSNHLNFSQIKSYIFTEACCRQGIDKYLDVIKSNQSFAYKANIFAYFGDVKDLLQTKNIDEEYLGVYLEDLIKTNKDNARILESDINKYVSDSSKSENISFITKLAMEGKEEEAKIKVDGAIVMKNNKLINVMNEEDVCIYKILNDNVNKGEFEVTNPNKKTSLISMEILKNDIKSNVNIINDKLVLNKKINIKSVIAEIQEELVVNNESVYKIEKEVAEVLTKRASDFYRKYYNQSIDIFHLKDFCEKRHPDYILSEEVLKNSVLNITISIDIENDGMMKNKI